MSKKDKINVQGTDITIISEKNSDYISLTDMVGYKDALEARATQWCGNYANALTDKQ